MLMVIVLPVRHRSITVTTMGVITVWGILALVVVLMAKAKVSHTVSLSLIQITNISYEYRSIVINNNVTVTDPPTLLAPVPF